MLREGKAEHLRRNRAKSHSHLDPVTQRFICGPIMGENQSVLEAVSYENLSQTRPNMTTEDEHTRNEKNVVKLNCYHCCVTLSVYNRSELRPRLARQLHHWLNHRLCQDYSRSRHSLYTFGPFEMRNDLTRALLYKTTWKCMKNEWLLTRCSQTHGHSVSVFVCCAVPAQL